MVCGKESTMNLLSVCAVGAITMVNLIVFGALLAAIFRRTRAHR